MSFKNTSGTSLTEVMVMMVILSISIVGIYSMVNSGQQLARLTNTRLTAINIAREGLESVATLRDTFGLKGYEPGECQNSAPIIGAFFSIDEELLTQFSPYNCPQIGLEYTLTDNKKLEISTDTEVCINEFGWYSQEYSIKTGSATTCTSTTSLCGGNATQSCKTRFQRKITFGDCDGINNTAYCVHIFSKVWWGIDPDDLDTSLTLDQIITRLN